MRKILKMMAVATLGFASACIADVEVSKIFSSEMVLQRDKAVHIWGTANTNENSPQLTAGSFHFHLSLLDLHNLQNFFS